MNKQNFSDLKKKLLCAKQRLLRMHYESKTGHIGGNLSILDALFFVQHGIMQPDDVCVLSKGHAAGALYITLWSLGKLTEEHLQQFHQDNSKIAGHPIGGWSSAIPISTGSLGHGFPVAAGMALGKQLKGEKGNIFCFTSDGEWEEGSNWEALIFAAHHKLNNLVVFIDANRLQGFGTTEEVASLEPLHEKIAAFGVHTQEVDGHDLEALANLFTALPRFNGPRIFLLRTVKGHGISFMKNKMEWHYLPLTSQQYEQATLEIEPA